MAEQDKKTDDITIVVNGDLHAVPEREVSYQQVVELGFPGLGGDVESTFTVLYRKTDSNRPDGSLVPGASVKVHKKGSSFSVSRSIRS